MESQNQTRKWEVKDFSSLNMIGKGRFGVVYKAIELNSNQPVALKIISKKNFASQGMQIQLKRQIVIHSKLKHRFINQIYGWFQNQHSVFVVLQYCEGESLFHQLKATKKNLTQDQIKLYMKQLASALTYLHERNVIHRDIKLQNILISNEGLKLIDFGWAVHSIAQGRTTFCGTVDYLAPELVRHENYDSAVDVYSLGVVFYQLLYNRTPFSGENEQDLMNNILKADLKFNEEVKQISEDAKDLIQKMLNPNPYERIKIRCVLEEHPYLKDVVLQ